MYKTSVEKQIFTTEITSEHDQSTKPIYFHFLLLAVWCLLQIFFLFSLLLCIWRGCFALGCS